VINYFIKFKINKGFTLIELLVVIAIIGILSSVVLASLNSARAKARDSERLSTLKQISNALELYASDHGGSYPSTGSIHYLYIDPGCTQNVVSPNLKTADWIPGLVPTYIPSLSKDPKPFYGGCYIYSSDGNKFILSAYGTVEASSNGGKMNSDFGYREFIYMDAPVCRYSTSYSSLDSIHRKSFTITNLTVNDLSICPKIGA
jgi:prepilin-type N-terminal cleavage/methylation domain-containing protein